MVPVAGAGRNAAMICTCAEISVEDVRRAVDWMRASDPAAPLTLGRICRILGKTPDCGNCVRLLVETMRREAAAAQLRAA